MWWVAKLQGRATGPRVPSSPYKLTNCRLSYDTWCRLRPLHTQVDYGLYMFSLAREIGAAPNLARWILERPAVALACAFGQAHARSIQIRRSLRARRRRGRLRDRVARAHPHARPRDELHLRPDPVLLRGRERRAPSWSPRAEVAIPAHERTLCLASCHFPAGIEGPRRDLVPVPLPSRKCDQPRLLPATYSRSEVPLPSTNSWTNSWSATYGDSSAMSSSPDLGGGRACPPRRRPLYRPAPRS